MWDTFLEAERTARCELERSWALGWATAHAKEELSRFIARRLQWEAASVAAAAGVTARRLRRQARRVIAREARRRALQSSIVTNTGCCQLCGRLHLIDHLF